MAQHFTTPFFRVLGPARAVLMQTMFPESTATTAVAVAVAVAVAAQLLPHFAHVRCTSHSRTSAVPVTDFSGPGRPNITDKKRKKNKIK